MKQTAIVAIILGVLVLISVVQAFQLNSLKTKITEGGLSIKSAGGSTPLAASSGDSGRATASLPSNIQNLPQMVGGC